AALFHAVEHQALAGIMAERAGISVPRVDRIVRAGSTALLVMEWADGSAGPPASRPDRRRPARAAVGGGGQAAPGRDRAPVAAGRQRDGRPGRTAHDR